jgi:GxxExxY protein
MRLLFEEETGKILGAAIEVHRHLGPGLLESVYQTCLAREFTIREMSFVQQKEVPVAYKDLRLDQTLRLDFIVFDKIVVELKAVDTLLPIHEAQLLTYLKLTGCKVGMLLNFNSEKLMDGYRRRAL